MTSLVSVYKTFQLLLFDKFSQFRVYDKTIFSNEFSSNGVV